ncbi:MAG: hypothetical protein ACLTYN_07160 [Dysosmobacter welbionis]
MAHQFLARFCGEYNKSLTCSPRFLAFLEQYDWPGNVRQLENLMERLVITAQDPILDIPALPLEYTADASAPAGAFRRHAGERMDAYEAQIIRDSTSGAAPQWPWPGSWHLPGHSSPQDCQIRDRPGVRRFRSMSLIHLSTELRQELKLTPSSCSPWSFCR